MVIDHFLHIVDGVAREHIKREGLVHIVLYINVNFAFFSGLAYMVIFIGVLLLI